jgi:LuxR family maltose regulon positive regulatory protein
MLQEAARRGAVVSPPIQILALSQLSLIAIDDDDWDTAARLLAQAREQIDRCGLGDYPSMVIAHAASALVRGQQGQVERAQDDLANATRLLDMLSALPPWYEAELRIVLARACGRLDDPARGRALLEEAKGFLEWTQDAAILSGWLEAAALSSTATEDQLHVPLTKAELRTLQYLPSHLSFREIGERVHVSPNTVKTQAQAVYRKLGASSRGEAVERARGARLLDEEPTTSFEPGDASPSGASSVT